MSVIVTLHIFSGRPDPVWELAEDQVLQLTERLRSTQERSLLRPPGIAGALGYRGFSILSTGEKALDSHIFVHQGLAEIGGLNISLNLGSPETELFLLETGRAALPNDLYDYVSEEIGGEGFKAEAAPTVFAAPPYDPGKWNNNPYIMANNNCYNYANDKITNSFAQPGRGSGQMYTTFSCDNVGAASQRDGQILIPNPNVTPAAGQIICLVIWPGNDFHWYRRDSNGLWSHKPGSTPAKNTDNSGNLIQSPATCNRGPYVNLCSYFNSIPAQTQIW